MKPLILVPMLITFQTCYAVDLTDYSIRTFDDVFTANVEILNLEQSKKDDDAFFQSLLRQKFSPTVSSQSESSCYIENMDPLPPVKYYVELAGYRESWTPLFDNYKREKIWTYAL